MPTVFFLNKLKEGIKAGDYEEWVREFDYPSARTMPAIKSYKVHKISGALRGDRAYDYIESVEIPNLADYLKELGSENRKKLHDQWNSYVGESIAVFGEPI